jgi:Flp pilus assembly pilin Flp
MVRDLRCRTCREGPQSGQTMAEYAIVLSVIIIGVIASMTALSGAIMGGIDRVAGLVASVS